MQGTCPAQARYEQGPNALDFVDRFIESDFPGKSHPLQLETRLLHPVLNARTWTRIAKIPRTGTVSESDNPPRKR